MPAAKSKRMSAKLKPRASSSEKLEPDFALHDKRLTYAIEGDDERSRSVRTPSPAWSTNLASNARRYANTLNIDAKHSAKWLTIVVDDDGPGIPDRTARTSSSPSSGSMRPAISMHPAPASALRIARDIARSHGGNVTWRQPARAVCAQRSGCRREISHDHHLASDMTWLNSPPFVEERDGALHVRSGDKTDFWQGTYYGFHRDDGHFLHRSRHGDFTAELCFSGRYEALYDQAGMMVRADADALDEMRNRIYRMEPDISASSSPTAIPIGRRSASIMISNGCRCA